jgi:DNA-damage-inducible protein J
MKPEMLTTRIDHDTKIKFINICDEIGLSPSQAIKLFAKAVVNEGGIPFALKRKSPNSQTLAAMKELDEAKGTKVASLSELIHSLDA